MVETEGLVTPELRGFQILIPGQRNTDIGDRYVEMMVVVDKAVIGSHRNDEEVKRYVLTYLKLASEN
jgi:hypothetical protein